MVSDLDSTIGASTDKLLQGLRTKLAHVNDVNRRRLYSCSPYVMLLSSKVDLGTTMVQHSANCWKLGIYHENFSSPHIRRLHRLVLYPCIARMDRLKYSESPSLRFCSSCRRYSVLSNRLVLSSASNQLKKDCQSEV